jgi:L-rhamnose mutarotase
MASAARNNPKVREWETLMWQFQAPTPWTPVGEKWVAMAQIFDLRQQS